MKQSPWISRWAGIVLLCLTLLVSISSIALAQPSTSGLTSDPTDLARAAKLKSALTEARDNIRDEKFLNAFRHDPNSSKRAFVALIIRAANKQTSDSEAARADAGFAAVLAQLISVQFGDPTPLEIYRGFVSHDDRYSEGLAAYLARLEPAALEPFVAGLSPTQKRQLEAGIAPLFLKDLRLRYAQILAHPQLIISELDTFKAVTKALRASFEALGLEQKDVEIFWETEVRDRITLQRLAVLADIGLLDEFEKNSQALLEASHDKAQAASTLITGFRAACRQDRPQLASTYLEQARACLALPETDPNPVMEYVVRTADYQLRLLKGLKPTENSVTAEFDKAWSVLDTYVPFQFNNQEMAWSQGRQATRFWVDQLAPYPTALGTKAYVVLIQIDAWTQAVGKVDVDNRSAEGMVKNSEVCSIGIALVDQMTYIYEAFKEKIVTQEQLDVLQAFTRSMIAPGESLSQPKSEGFPVFNLSNGGLVPELLGRCRYLESFIEKTPLERQMSLLTEALDFMAETKNPDVTVEYLLKIGQRLSDLGAHDQALVAWKQALTIAEELSFVQRRLQAASLLAKEYGRRQDWPNASLYADKAAKTIQDTAPLLSLRSVEGKEMALQSREMTNLAVKASIEADKPEAALAALTRGQQVESASVQMEGQKAAQAEAKSVLQSENQVVALASEVKRLEGMPASQTRDSLLESTQKLMADTKAQFLLESRELRKKYSALYSSVLRFDPLNLPDIQKALPADVAVVQYFPTDDALYIFTVTHDAFRLRSVAIGEKALGASVYGLVKAIRKGPGDVTKLNEESTRLYNALIAPVDADIASKSVLILIPSGQLNSLPFACLTNGEGVPLVERKQLLELAKSTDLMRISEEKPKPLQSVVAFANATEDLPAAAREGEQIASLFPQSKLFEGKQATRANFFAFGGKAEVLHLATHGEWNLNDSLDNYLALAGQDRVAQEEIFALGLDDTSIVILSACDTAMGDGADTNYVASLAEAFWIAGSRSVVATLWAVNDESTSLLMTEFYKQMKSGSGKAEALRKAQATVRGTKGFEHPYFWAGFVLFGDWR